MPRSSTLTNMQTPDLRSCRHLSRDAREVALVKVHAHGAMKPSEHDGTVPLRAAKQRRGAADARWT